MCSKIQCVPGTVAPMLTRRLREGAVSRALVRCLNSKQGRQAFFRRAWRSCNTAQEQARRRRAFYAAELAAQIAADQTARRNARRAERRPPRLPTPEPAAERRARRGAERPEAPHPASSSGRALDQRGLKPAAEGPRLESSHELDATSGGARPAFGYGPVAPDTGAPRPGLGVRASRESVAWDAWPDHEPARLGARPPAPAARRAARSASQDGERSDRRASSGAAWSAHAAASSGRQEAAQSEQGSGPGRRRDGSGAGGAQRGGPAGDGPAHGAHSAEGPPGRAARAARAGRQGGDEQAPDVGPWSPPPASPDPRDAAQPEPGRYAGFPAGFGQYRPALAQHGIPAGPGRAGARGGAGTPVRRRRSGTRAVAEAVGGGLAGLGAGQEAARLHRQAAYRRVPGGLQAPRSHGPFKYGTT